MGLNAFRFSLEWARIEPEEGTFSDDALAHYAPSSAAATSGGWHGVPVLGYCFWTLLDNFEWIFGDDLHHGLHSVDRQTFVRTAKPSAAAYAGEGRSGGRRLISRRPGTGQTWVASARASRRTTPSALNAVSIPTYLAGSVVSPSWIGTAARGRTAAT